MPFFTSKYAIIKAVKKNNITQLTSVLKKKPNLNIPDKDGWTALIWAASSGGTKPLKLLIEAGADLDAQNGDGNTALIWAAWNGHTESVQLLIEAGADTSNLSAENKEKYKNLISKAQPQQPYHCINGVSVSKYEGQLENGHPLRLIFNFKAGTVRECIGDTLGPVRYFQDLCSAAEKDDVTAAYDFLKAGGKTKDIPSPFFVKKAENVFTRKTIIKDGGKWKTVM